MAAEQFMGIEIGGTKLQLVIGGTDGIIEARRRYTIDPSAGAAGIRADISQCFQEWQDQLRDIAAIGVGFGGPVDWASGTIRVSNQVQGWESFNLKNWLEELTDKPVFIDNDANTAALGEGVYGWGMKYAKLFYMTLGSGIGGGMFADGKIYHGMAPGELEIGHLRLDKNGSTLESRCSGWAVNEKVIRYINTNPGSLLSVLSKAGNVPGASLLGPALAQQDPAAQQIVREIADDLAYALSHLVHLLHPEVIVIGGGLSLLGEGLRAPLVSALPGYLMHSFLPAPPVEIAKLGEDVVPAGAVELARLALKQHTYTS
ncbi:ROK family protein [Pedobacter ginsengisoli]|uniref:ROK family protein n=1 Tax=Pedobacter ginsengisoli TaxID=363852 RepID=UPI002550C95F|nr:ROK family protein [Pedobacter ginsengisoli]